VFPKIKIKLITIKTLELIIFVAKLLSSSCSPSLKSECEIFSFLRLFFLNGSSGVGAGGLGT
jgi:hypothetical protein